MGKEIVFKEENGEELEIEFQDSAADDNPLLPSPDLAESQNWQAEEAQSASDDAGEDKASEKTAEAKPAEAADEDDLEEKARRIHEESVRRTTESRQSAQPEPEEEKSEDSQRSDQEDFRAAFIVEKIKNIDFKIEKVVDKIAQAEEDGDTHQKLQYERELRAYENDRDRLETTQRTLQEQATAQPEAKKEKKQPEPAADKQAEQPLSMEAARWIARNEWFQNPSNDHEGEKQRFALAQYKYLIGKYKDADNPELYKEIDKMIDKHFSSQTETTPKPKKETKQPPVSGVNADSQSSKGGKKRATIDPATRAVANNITENMGFKIEEKPEFAAALVKNIDKREKQYNRERSSQ